MITSLHSFDAYLVSSKRGISDRVGSNCVMLALQHFMHEVAPHPRRRPTEILVCHELGCVNWSLNFQSRLRPMHANVHLTNGLKQQHPPIPSRYRGILV
jgi:hypothetical protein